MSNFGMNSFAWNQFLDYEVPKDSSWNLWVLKAVTSVTVATKERANSI